MKTCLRSIESIPKPKFSLGDGVCLSIDEPDPCWPLAATPWLRHWCRGLVLGVTWGGGHDGPITSAGWVYRVLVLEHDGSGFFSIWDEPVIISANEEEIGRSARANQLRERQSIRGKTRSLCQGRTHDSFQ